MTQPGTEAASRRVLPDPGFRADVGKAASVWRGNPVVPLLYLLVALTYTALALVAPGESTSCPESQQVFDRCPTPTSDAVRFAAISLLALPVSVFHIGLCGAARVWYLRRFAGHTMTFGEVWRIAWSMWVRFLLLSLLFAAVTTPVWIVVGTLRFTDHETAALIVAGLGLAAADVAFTFVPVGLALYNAHVGQSLRGGLVLLRQCWPRCAAYALVPPLALTLLGRLGGSSTGRALAVLGAFTGPLLTLLFAGASVRFVTRRHVPPTEWGAP